MTALWRGTRFIALSARLPLVQQARPRLKGLRVCSMAAFKVSDRVQATDEPCIVKVKQLMEGVEGVVSLAQGVVHWSPPQRAMDAAIQAASTTETHSYGPAQGMPALRDALKHKVQQENGLKNVDIMVTAGANQAFVNVLLTLTDAADKVVLFRPYYFNHLMACQMTGGARNVVLGEPDQHSMKPDLQWLQGELQGPDPPKMVTIVNPCNPAGFLLSQEEVEHAQQITAAAGAWLVLDNTYEHFTYEARKHFCMAAPNVINIFSFSKAYGMMGWRVGYIAMPDESQAPGLAAQMVKVQDTIPICPTQMSQTLALEAVREGRSWVTERVAGLRENRELARDALSVLGEDAVLGEAAIYLFAKLPPALQDDTDVVQKLITDHKVTLIPGSACGAPGHIRVAFANLTTEECKVACARLRAGLQALLDAS